MAKKTNRMLIKLNCSVCNSHNYTSERNKINTPDKLVIKKLCPNCKKHTEHKESK